MTKTIKKALSYMLCLCMMISLVPAMQAQAASESYVGAAVYEGLLEGMDIIREDDQKPASYSEGITRLDALKYVLRFAGVETGADTGASPFTDINDAAVTTAASVGIVSTVYDEFRPNDYATYHEAIAMIVNAMGYTGILDPNISYPENYMSLARTLKIECSSLKGNNDGKMTYMGLFELMYEGLNSYIIEEEFITLDGITYKLSDDTTYLESRFDVLKDTGIVQAVPEATITGDQIEEGTVIIDGILYSTDNSAVGALLGYKTEFYYSEEGAAGADRRLVYIYKKLNDETVISSSDFEYATKNGSQLTLYYKEGNRNKKATLSGDVTVVCNGMPYKTTQTYAEWFSIEYGNISLVNNDGSEGYDIAFINDFDTVVVSVADAEEEIIYAKYSSMETIDLENVNGYRIMDADGNEMELSEIAENDVISVAKSRDGSIYTMYVARSKFTGKITMKYEEDGETWVEAGGEEHRFIADTSDVKLRLNEDCTALFDVFGSIADIAYLNAESERIGYFVGMSRKEGVSDDWNQIAILEAGGEEPTVFGIGSKVKIDGKSYKNSEIVEGTPLIDKDGNFIRCGVKFEIDKDGNVTKIDTPYLNTDAEDPLESMHQNHTYKDGKLNYKGGKLGGRGFITGRTLCVIEPEEPEDIMAYESFSSVSEKEYDVELYTDGNVSPVLSVAVFKGLSTNKFGVGLGDKSPMYVYDKSMYTRDDDDNFVKTISLVREGTVYNVPVPEEGEWILGNDLKRGDVVRIERNSKGELVKFHKIFDYASKSIAKPFTDPDGKTVGAVNTTDPLGVVYRIVAGYVYYKDGDYYKIDKSMTGDEDSIEAVAALSNTHIYEVDESGVTSRVATASDIKTYLKASGNATYAICHLSFEETKSFLLIKNNDYEAPDTGDYYALFTPGAGNTEGSFKRYANAGASITLPENKFENYGYKFMGWTDGADTYQPGETYTMPEADVVFYPTWKQAYVFEFVSGASDATGTAPKTQTEFAGTEIEIPANTFTRIGYKFTGWKGSDNKNYQPGDKLTAGTENMTFTAQWAEAITVSFAAGGGSGSAPAAIGEIAGESITLPDNTFTGPTAYVGSYSFDGWKDPAGSVYKAGASYTMPSVNTELTAVWKYVAPEAAQVVSLSTSQYAMVHSETPDTHVAVSTGWTTNLCSGRQMLVKVDLSKYDAEHIKSAVIKFTGYNVTYTLNAYKLTSQWDAATVTYNSLKSQIESLKAGSPGATSSSSVNTQVYTVDVAGLIDENGMLNIMLELPGTKTDNKIYGPATGSSHPGVKITLGY